MIDVSTRESDSRDLMVAVQQLMDSEVSTRTVRKMVIAGLRPIGKAQKAVVAVRSGRLKRATGKPVFSRGTGRAKNQQIARAVVGINTGTKNANGTRAYHGAIWALGTFPRWTGLDEVPGRRRRLKGGGRLGRPNGKRIAYRGFTKSNLVIKSASLAAAPAGIEAMKSVLRNDLPLIVRAARKK